MTRDTRIRLPLRHKVGERVGVRWCSGFRGRSSDLFSEISNQWFAFNPL
jgi:hypothetical protein